MADATGAASLLGEDDNDRFEFTSGSQLSNNTVVGGAGTDTLAFTAAAEILDADLVNLREVEWIIASDEVGNEIELGLNAQASGVRTLFGGISSDFLSAADMTDGPIWIQGAVGASTLGDTLATGIDTSRAILVANNLAQTDNYLQISGQASLLGNNSIVGGVDSDDVLYFAFSGNTIKDSDFINVRNIDKIIYVNSFQNNIALGVTAENAFSGDTLYIEGVGSSQISDIIDLSNVKTKKVHLNLRAEDGGAVITAGLNDNTLIGGDGIVADDRFIFNSVSALNGASVVGGGGIDTLRVAANAQTITSDILSGVSGVEVLEIAGAGNRVTLEGNWSDGDLGITTIVGGTGPNTIDASDYNSAPNALTWRMGASNGSDSLLGGLNGNLFQIKNGANLQNSYITGNTGNDTIQLLAGGQTLGDDTFQRAQDIEILHLGSAINGNRITLGNYAENLRIATVVGGTRADTIDASLYTTGIWIDASASSGSRLLGSSASNNNTLVGGSSGGNEFVVGALGTHSIVGGADGRDTLTFNSSTTIEDFNANGEISDGSTAAISKVGTIKFNAAGNQIVLGTDALVTGIRTLVGGEGSDNGMGNTFDTSAYDTAGVLFQVTDQNYLKNITTLVGGAGVDTLRFSRDGVSVTDEVVANLYNIDVLRTANGNNLFVLSDQFVAAGIDSIIGGAGADTLDISDNFLYTPTPVSDVPGATSDIITYDASAGSGYTLIGTTNNFPYAKVIGGTAGGAVLLDGISLIDSDFTNMFQANAGTLTMRTATGVSVELGVNAKGMGLNRLNMADGDDQVDVRAFAGTLTVSGGGGNDLVETSFAALADLTFLGSAGSDTLQLVGSDARAITALNGDFDALVLNAGNNFVALGNAAGLSTIYGGGGFDTIHMLTNTTGIDFVMDSAKLGSSSGFASLNGGSGSDTLTLSTAPGTLSDSQFTRIGLRNLTGGGGGEIENFVTYSDPTTGQGGSTYNLGSISDNAGISKVYFHTNDIVDGSGRVGGSAKAINFVFTDPTVIGTATITGTGKTDTLTAMADASVITNFTITDSDLSGVTALEFFVFQNANASSGVNLEIDGWADNAGITTFIGGTGNDTFDAATGGFYSLNSSIVGGAGDDSILGGTGNDTLCGTSATVFGAGEKDTLTGSSGNDRFILGDASNAYYNTSSGAGDFAYLTNFHAGDILQLKDMIAALDSTSFTNGVKNSNYSGYLFSSSDIYNSPDLQGSSANSYLYADTTKDGLVNPGDNLIAAIATNQGSGLGGEFESSDLANSAIFKFV
jgi:hypothetical protein